MQLLSTKIVIFFISADKARVLGVVGMGHMEGVTKYYGKMTPKEIVPLLL